VPDGYGNAAYACNHWDKRKQWCAGGNVASLDGSVRWMSILPPDDGGRLPTLNNNAGYTNEWVNSPGSGNNSRYIPSNAIFLQLVGDGSYPLPFNDLSPGALTPGAGQCVVIGTQTDTNQTNPVIK